MNSKIFKWAGLKKKLVMVAILSFSLGMSMTSCTDWLEMESYTSDDVDYIFENETKADLFVQGCYRGLIHKEMFYNLGMGETVVHTAEDNFSSKYKACNYDFDPLVPTTVTTIFKEGYRIIESTNVAISRLKKMPETVKRNQLLGEALAIRAFCYHNLIRIYGDVPAVYVPLEEMDANDENRFYPKRSPRDGIYDQIVSDLQQATEWLPWYEESGYTSTERLTKQGAYALLARIALYAGGYSLRWDLETNDPATLKMARRDDATRVKELYEIANDACFQIKEHGKNSLVQGKDGMSGFQYLWYNHCQRKLTETESEMIWQLAEYGDKTNSEFGLYLQPGSYNGTYGSRKTLQFVLPTYYLSFDKKDTRRDVTCTSYSIYPKDGGKKGPWIDTGTTYSSILLGKCRIQWCVEPQAASQRNINIPLIRYSDVLLMYAETENYLNNGPTPEAEAALKEVRTRAGVGELPIPTDQQGFEDALVQERKWEFAGEFTLRSDLIRMGRLAKELRQAKQDMKDLSDRKGAYANVPKYRLYKYQEDGQKYGDKFLAIDYIELTDPTEIATVKNIPEDEKQYSDYETELIEIVKNHCSNVTSQDKWYPRAMFEAFSSEFNMKGQAVVGFAKSARGKIQVGKIIYQQPTGSEENGGSYPAWIDKGDGSDGLFYGFKENFSELCPFAAKSSGHPLIDNPNLTQLPGY